MIIQIILKQLTKLKISASKEKLFFLEKNKHMEIIELKSTKTEMRNSLFGLNKRVEMSVGSL